MRPALFLSPAEAGSRSGPIPGNPWRTPNSIPGMLEPSPTPRETSAAASAAPALDHTRRPRPHAEIDPFFAGCRSPSLHPSGSAPSPKAPRVQSTPPPPCECADNLPAGRTAPPRSGGAPPLATRTHRRVSNESLRPPRAIVLPHLARHTQNRQPRREISDPKVGRECSCPPWNGPETAGRRLPSPPKRHAKRGRRRQKQTAGNL